MSASLAAFERPRPGAPNLVIKSGPLFMSSRGRGWRLWKKRWFILTRTSFVFFKNDPSVLPQRGGEVNLTLGGIDLNNSGSVVVREDKKLLTVLFPDGRDSRAFTVKAETSEDLYEWKAALEHALAQAPSVVLVMGHNGIFRNDTSNARGGSFPNQWMGKHSVKSLVVGRPILLALEDIDGSPSFLEKALQFIENFGIKVEGILRQSADVQEVERRVQEYEQGKTEFGPEEDAHVVGDCIKHVLQELPSSPVPASCCRALLEAYKIDQKEARISAMRSAIFETFPVPNLRLLLRMLEMMHIISSHSHENWMTPSAVAACMAPLLLRPLLAGECELDEDFYIRGDSSSQLLAGATAANIALAIVTTLLEEYENIFYVSAEEWLMEETNATQHAEFVSNMYLQVAEQVHQRGFNYMVLQKGGYLIKMFKPGLVSSDIQSNIKGLTEIKKWGEEQQLFSLHKGSWRRSTDPSFKESSYCLIEEDETVGDEEGSRSNDLSLLENLYSFIEEDELLGIESQKEEIVSMLVGVPSSHLVISLVGIGGVGKTALASVVYQSEEVQQHFDFHAWINVTESHRFENLFRHLTRMICKDGDSSEEEMDAMKEQELIYHLKQRLSTKRYLIIFDDVWQIDFWEVMNNVFPDSKNGSRIIITTRNNAIAASYDTLVCLQPLSKEMAWELFCKQAFRFENGNCPHELLELSLEIVRRCHGLPLVIKAIAGLLSSEMNVSEWKVLLNHFNDDFIENPQINSVVSTIISHSYDDLPFHVRLCFLSFGIFTNIPIPELKLLRLWIAKGFVKEEIGKTLEQVAEMYLNELINRNLVQVSHLKNDGAERICRVHGFMHEILVAKAKQLDIFQVEFASTSTSVRGEGSASASIFQQIDINRLSFSSDRFSFFSDDIED